MEVIMVRKPLLPLFKNYCHLFSYYVKRMNLTIEIGLERLKGAYLIWYPPFINVMIGYLENMSRV
jgi:hypothetical protein